MTADFSLYCATLSDQYKFDTKISNILTETWKPVLIICSRLNLDRISCRSILIKPQFLYKRRKHLNREALISSRGMAFFSKTMMILFICLNVFEVYVLVIVHLCDRK